MKKLITLILAASFVLGTVISASAVEITAQGSFDFAFGWQDRNIFDNTQDWRLGNASEDSFYARQRERLQVNFIASENVSGTIYFEMGETEWGQMNGRQNGQIGTDGVGVEIRRAYIEFNVPNTELLFRVGLQGMALPNAVAGSPIMGSTGTDMAGVVAVYPVNDMFTIAALWARPWNGNGRTDPWVNGSQNDEIDIFGMYTPITIDGMMTITPYVAYAIAGTDAIYNNTNGTAFANNWGYAGGMVSEAALYGAGGGNPWNANVVRNYIDNDYQYYWWAGTAVEFTMLDPLTFGLDVAYGTSIDPSDQFLSRQGWYFAGRVDYATPYVTPGLVGWYSTGDDDNIWNGSERMPTLDGTFQATTFGFDGFSVLNSGDTLAQSAEGTWGIALQLNDISFIEDLTHQFIVAYIAGTNSTGSMYDYRAPATANGFAAYTGNGSMIALTNEDSAWEIDFNTKYQIYENLAAVVELGMLDVQRSADGWRSQANRRNSGVYNATAGQRWDTSTAWKAVMGLQYRF